MIQSFILQPASGSSLEKDQFEMAQTWIQAQSDTLQHHVNPEGPLKISQVRSLINSSTYFPYSGEHQWFVITNADAASLPAQHALLKILEEPPPHSSLVLVSSHPSSLLDTVRSRCVLIQLTESSATKAQADVQVFTAYLPQEPTKIAACTYTEIIERVGEVPDREAAIQELESLAAFLRNHADFPSPPIIKSLEQTTKSLQELRQNALYKLSLEHCYFQLKQVLSQAKKT